MDRAEAFLDAFDGLVSRARPKCSRLSAAWMQEYRGRRRVGLPHSERPEWSIEAAPRSERITVTCSGLRARFDETTQPGRAPHSQAIDLITALLHGEIELHKTYRGRSLLKVEHFRRTERRPLGVSRHRGLGALRLWSPKRVEVERVSFL